MTAITRAGVRWPWRVAALWLAAVVTLTIIGIPLNQKLNPPQLGGGASLAGALSQGNFTEDTYLLLDGPRRVLAARGPAIVAALERATHAPMISPFSGLGREAAGLWRRGRPASVLVELAPQQSNTPDSALARFRRAVRSAVRPPITAVITGPAPLRGAVTNASLDAAASAALIAFPALLLVLLLVFRSVAAAAVPLAVAGATVLGGRGVLLLLAKVMNIDASSDVLLSMIGLALGVDYSLLIVTRYREAVASGDSPGHAVHVAAHTAGKTASFAGLVLTGILAITMGLSPPGALSSAAAGAIVATAMSVVSALVAVPAMLTLIGRWISPLPPERRGLLGKTVEAALHHPRLALLAAVPLIVIAIGATKLTTLPPSALVLSSNSAGGRELVAQADAGLGPGLEVVLSRSAGPLTAPLVLRAEQRLESELARLTPITVVIGPGGIARLARRGRLSARFQDALGFDVLASVSSRRPVRLAAANYVLDVARGGGIGRIALINQLGFNDPRTAGLLARFRRLVAPFTARTGVRAAIGGQAPALLAFSDQTKSRLLVIILGVALVTFLALVAVLRSVLLAAIAVCLNLLTVVTMFGVLSFLYVGSHPVVGHEGGLDVISTVCIFAITFALSIDYQVFLLARMREGYLESQDAIDAIRFGVEHTARIVTGAALIMLATFAAFGTTDVSNVQEFGLGLGSAIAVDATVVRLVLLPALLRLSGARAWWFPDRLERRLPELDVEGFAYVRARNELATRAADVW